MEADEVEVVFTVLSENGDPVGLMSRWVAGCRKMDAVEVAAHESGLAIDQELVADMGRSAETERAFPNIQHFPIAKEFNSGKVGFR